MNNNILKIMIIIIVIKRVHVPVDEHGASVNLDFYKVACRSLVYCSSQGVD